MSSFHTVVIGGGDIGVSVAYYLARRGQKVTLIEQDEIASGCSQGNAAQITPGHLPLNQPGAIRRNLRLLLMPSSPLFIPPRFDLKLWAWLWRFQRASSAEHVRKATKILCQLGLASFELFEELASEIDFGFCKSGRLEVCHKEKTLKRIREEGELLASLGFETRMLSGPELSEYEPVISKPMAGALYLPLSAHCHPEKFVVELARAAEALGVHVRTHTKVKDLEIRGGRATGVVTEGDMIEADAVVLACGAWMDLASRLGLRMPIVPGKGYHLDLDLDDKFLGPKLRPKTPFILVERRIFVSPVDDFLRLAGTMEFSGFNLKLRKSRLKMLISGASEYLEGLDQLKVRSRWTHMRPMSCDGLPFIGKAPRAENIWIATGHGMLGLTQGPITGKLIAEWITDGQPGMDITALRPDRF